MINFIQLNNGQILEVISKNYRHYKCKYNLDDSFIYCCPKSLVIKTTTKIENIIGLWSFTEKYKEAIIKQNISLDYAKCFCRNKKYNCILYTYSGPKKCKFKKLVPAAIIDNKGKLKLL